MQKTQENYLAGRRPDEINNSGGYQVGTPAQHFSSQTGQFTTGTGHLGTQAVASQQIGYPEGHQYLSGQSGHLGTQAVVHPGVHLNWQTGQHGGVHIGNQSVGGQAVLQGGQKFGAFELMEVNEVLNDYIDGINQFELYGSHVKDQNLLQILNNQLNHMYSSYQNMVNYMHNQGVSSAVPYRMPKTTGIKYGLRQPGPMEPNANVNVMDDRDVASGMVGWAKLSAMVSTGAALKCADPNLRNMITNCTVSSINQAYELFQYMNQRGMCQIPTLAEQTSQTLMQSYQVGSKPTFQ